MRICVFGVGGVGGLLAGLLARAGQEVVVVARGEARRRIREKGLHVESSLGVFDVPLETATPGDSPPPDAVLLAVKAWQVADAAAALAPWLSQSAIVVPLQNGVDAPDECALALGRDRVVGGLCRMLSWVVEPGHVKHIGDAPKVTLGAWHRPLDAREDALRAALVASGIGVDIADDFRGALWEKLLFLASFGGVAALARADAEQIRTVPETRALLAAAFEEVRAVASGCGVRLADDVVAKTLRFVDGLPANATPSIQRDVIADRPSELDALSGAVVRRAREAGVAAPVHGVIFAALRPHEISVRRVG